MGCNNSSHLRPLFRRCRRSKKEDSVNLKQSPGIADGPNHIGEIEHQIEQPPGSVRNSQNIPPFETTNNEEESSPFCVPLLAQSEASSSQIDFFRMLDQKIEEGPDYDSEQERLDNEWHRNQNIEIWRKGILNSNHNHSWGMSRKEKLNRDCQWRDDED